MENLSSTQSLLFAEASAWDLVTYDNAKHFVLMMRLSGVPNTDPDLIHIVEQIGRYHRAQFEAARCLDGPWAFNNVA